jgi:hypothetical protein
MVDTSAANDHARRGRTWLTKRANWCVCCDESGPSSMLPSRELG